MKKKKKKIMYYRYYCLIWTETLIWRLWFFSVIQARSNFAPDLVLQPECGCGHLQVALSAKEKKLVLSRDSRTSLAFVLKKIQFVFFFFNNNMSILTYFYGFSKLQTFPVHHSCFYFFALSIFTNIHQKKEKEKKKTHSTPSDGIVCVRMHTTLSFLHYWRKLSAS